VTCGSAIKLKHIQSGGDYYLYSENSRNAGASNQQIVTFSKDHLNSDRTLWWLHGPHHKNCTTAQPVRCGETVRLSHVATKRNLHTHNQKSSLSRQQEITAWGDDYVGDGGDDWVVKCEGKFWKRNGDFRLFHRDTQRHLGGATTVSYDEKNCGAECPIMNHLEAFGRQAADEYSVFQVDRGLFL
jgi:dolichyl-phosphate-mannose--protein O-mannosyl transferase